MANIFMDLISASNDLWHERKGLDYTNNKKRQFKTIKKLSEKVQELSAKLEDEMILIKGLYQIPDDVK